MNVNPPDATTLIVAMPLAVYDDADMSLLDELLNTFRHVIVLLEGLRRATNSHIHPLTPAQRGEALKALFPDYDVQNRLIPIAIENDPYHRDKTRQNILTAIYRTLAIRNISTDRSEIRVLMTGNEADTVRSQNLVNNFKPFRLEGLHANRSLKSLFADGLISPPILKTWLANIRGSSDYARLQSEFVTCRKLQEGWRHSPYTPTFVAADAIIRWGGKTLLGRRADDPCAGLIVAPGGHIEPAETLFDTALREAQEETGLLPELIVKYFVGTKVFDDPDRDPRGRYISHAHYFEVPGEPPHVEGGDDMADAFWRDPNDFQPEEYGFDHWLVINDRP